MWPECSPPWTTRGGRHIAGGGGLARNFPRWLFKKYISRREGGAGLLFPAREFVCWRKNSVRLPRRDEMSLFMPDVLHKITLRNLSNLSAAHLIKCL